MSRRRTLTAIVAVAVAIPVGIMVVPSGASNPSSSTLVVPLQVGKSVSVSYKGTVPAGYNVTSKCTIPTSSDDHAVKLVVPPGAYRKVQAQVTFQIKWQPTTPVSDAILTVLNPKGEELDSSDGGSPQERIATNNPVAGTYTAQACGFAMEAPTDYVGTVTILAKPPVGGSFGKFPSVSSQGLSFTASVATDPQRDESEPEVLIDNGGNIYTCGPSGFSNVTDYAQVSTDGGDQFHLMGTPPRGQMSTAEGGGDCGMAVAPVKNAQGHYNFAYSGLGPLTNFSTATSKDTGRSLAGSPVSESPPGVDRQWHVFIDENTVFLNYNRVTQGLTVQKSTDGGLTYGPFVTITPEQGRIGPMRAILPKDMSEASKKAIVYFPYTSGTRVKLAMSHNGGETWTTCSAVDTKADPNGGFAIADHDKAGNIYVVYSEKGGDGDGYLVALPRSGISGCKGDMPFPGARPKTRFNRNRVETTVMPWVAAGGLPGRVAVGYYGTESIGNANDGKFKAAWDVYVSQTLNGMAQSPAWAQVKATTHPFHYNSICLNGLACNLAQPEGDRSLADFFAIDLNPKDGRLSTVFNASSKKPSDDLGRIATPELATQNAGPSNLGGMLKKKRNVLRSIAVDPGGDAIAPYSNMTPGVAVKLPAANHAALDFERATIGPEIDLASGKQVENGGFTVTMKVKGLSDSDLSDALEGTGSQSLVWLWRFYNGFLPNGVTAAYNPATGFTFGFDEYETRSATAGQADPRAEKIIVWPQRIPVPGKVNKDKGVIQLSVPRALLRELAGPTGNGQVPREQKAKPGSRFYEGTAYALGNTFTAVQKEQSYLYSVDNTPAMDFLLPGKVTTVRRQPGGTTGRREVPVGPQHLALAALIAAAGVLAGYSIRRTSLPRPALGY